MAVFYLFVVSTVIQFTLQKMVVDYTALTPRAVPRKGTDMKYELRPLTLADADKLYEFYQTIPASENGAANKAFGLTKPQFIEWIKQKEKSARGLDVRDDRVAATTYVLYVDDVPVGRSNLRHYLNAALEQDGGHIGLSVAPQYRGRGYSKILLHETLKRAKEKGINPVLVFHFADNIPACKMSESVGGKLMEERFQEKRGRLIRKYAFDTSLLD